MLTDTTGIAGQNDSGVEVGENDHKKILAEQGYLILDNWISKKEAQDIKLSAKEQCQDSAAGVEVFRPEHCSGWLMQLCANARLARMLEASGIMKPEFLSVKTVIKNATCAYASPWHQDRPYWGGIEKYSLWIALDDCTRENGCLRLIPGSHKQGCIEHIDYSEAEKDKFVNRLDHRYIDEARTIDLIIPAGTALLFHDCLFHASHENISGKDRWSLISTYRSTVVADPDTAAEWPNPYPMKT